MTRYLRVIATALPLVAGFIPLESAAADKAQLKLGASTYEKWCAGCHAEGEEHAGTVALHTKYNGTIPAVLAQRTDLSPEFIALYVRNGFSIMPTFRKTEISDAELAALSAYLIQKKQ